MIGFIGTWAKISLNYNQCSAIAVSTLYNSLLHTPTSHILVMELKHRNYDSLIKLHTPNITHEVFPTQPHSCNELLTTLHRTNLSYNRSSLYRFRMDHAESTSHMTATQRVHWRADCCLTTRYNIVH
jgi:hypothetical protein